MEKKQTQTRIKIGANIHHKLRVRSRKMRSRDVQFALLEFPCGWRARDIAKVLLKGTDRHGGNNNGN